jgi:uncharacterized protein YceH (UPF0502 family)
MVYKHTATNVRKNVSEEQSTTSETDDAPMLTDVEARILAALMEKQLTTPDAYPLTVKSLLSACNQKSNREPVTDYQQGETVRVLRELETRKFVRYEMGARSERYEQRLTHELSISKKQQALLTVMMLRGPQTINELQTRTQRMFEFQDNEDLAISLERMTQGDEPLAVLIPRSAGQREDRYGHLLCGVPEMPISAAGSTGGASRNKNAEIAALQQEVSQLRIELDRLYELTGHSNTEADNATEH